MVKTLEQDATYEIARHSHNWLKLKKDYLEVGDTIDLPSLADTRAKEKEPEGTAGSCWRATNTENEEYQTIAKSEPASRTRTFAKHVVLGPLIEEGEGLLSYDQGHEPDHCSNLFQVLGGKVR